MLTPVMRVHALHVFGHGLNHLSVQVDLTAYVEKHEFVFDAVLDEDVTNDEVSVLGV